MSDNDIRIVTATGERDCRSQKTIRNGGRITASSVSLSGLIRQAFLLKLFALTVNLFLFLCRYIPFVLRDFILQIAGVGFQQSVQHSFGRFQNLGTVPFFSVRFPCKKRIAVAGRNNFIQRVLLKILSKNIQYFFIHQHYTASFAQSKINSSNMISSTCAFNAFTSPTHFI